MHAEWTSHHDGSSDTIDHLEETMRLTTRTVHYQHQGVGFEGYLATALGSSTPKPSIMIVHTWVGRDEFACHKADQWAQWGYTAFAVDLYGGGKVGQTTEENAALMNGLLSDRNLLKERLWAALDTFKAQPETDVDRVAAMGFCFGGLSVLDLARSGADLRGVISFHGLFNAPQGLPTPPIQAKILILHGFDDPMATPEDAVSLGHELTRRGADWQMHLYSNTMHAFTNPKANDPGFGTVYNPITDDRSHQCLLDFLTEVLK